MDINVPKGDEHGKSEIDTMDIGSQHSEGGNNNNSSEERQTIKTITPSKYGFISARGDKTPNSARSNTSAPPMFSPDKVQRAPGKPILTPLPPSVLSSSLLGGLLSSRSNSRRNQVITRNSPLKQGTKNYLAESIVPLLIEGLTQLSISRPEKSDTSAGPAVWLAKYLLRRSDQSKDYVLKRRRGGIDVEVQTEDTEAYPRKKEVVNIETQTDKASGSSLSAIRELNGTNTNQSREININIRLDGALLPSHTAAITNSANNQNDTNSPVPESYDVLLGSRTSTSTAPSPSSQQLLKDLNPLPSMQSNEEAPLLDNNATKYTDTTISTMKNENGNAPNRQTLLRVDDGNCNSSSDNEIKENQLETNNKSNAQEEPLEQQNIRKQNIEKLKTFFNEICTHGHVPSNSLIVSRRQFQRSILSLGLQSMLSSSLLANLNTNNHDDTSRDKYTNANSLPGLSMLAKPRYYREALDTMAGSSSDNTISYLQFEQFCFTGTTKFEEKDEEKSEEMIETKERQDFKEHDNKAMSRAKSTNDIFANTITDEELELLEEDLQKTINSKRAKNLDEVDGMIDNIFSSIFSDPQINHNSIKNNNDKQKDQVSKEDIIFLLGMSPPANVLDYAEIMPSFQFLMSPQIYEKELFCMNIDTGDENASKIETISREEFVNFVKLQIARLNNKETSSDLVLDDFLNNKILEGINKYDGDNDKDIPSSSNLGTPYDDFSSARVKTEATKKLRLDKSLKKIFKTLDSKKDGFLDKREVLLSLSGHGNSKVANLLSYFEPLQALLKPKTFEEAFNIMDTESIGKVNFSEFRAFCNAVVVEAEEIALSGRPSIDGNGDDIVMDSARLSARVTKDLERDLELRALFSKLGAVLSNRDIKSGEAKVEKTEDNDSSNKGANPYLNKRNILRALHSNPSIVKSLEETKTLFALCKPQTFGATFDEMNVEKDGKVSWLEFRAFCTTVSENENKNETVESVLV